MSGSVSANESVKHPSDWTRDERRKVARAIAEHRLTTVDLFYWSEIDVQGRTAHDVAVEMMLTAREVEARLERARELLRDTLERPGQEAYLGRWLDRES
jgi:DNA-directed RNA polymerase specialized sigma24 family protein